MKSEWQCSKLAESQVVFLRTYSHHIFSGSDGWVFELGPLHQGTLVRLRKERYAVSRFAGLLRGWHSDPVEIALQDVIRPAAGAKVLSQAELAVVALLSPCLCSPVVNGSFGGWISA